MDRDEGLAGAISVNDELQYRLRSI